jgi:hypothetical protein
VGADRRDRDGALLVAAVWSADPWAGVGLGPQARRRRSGASVRELQPRDARGLRERPRRPQQPIEVVDDDDLGLVALDELDGPAKLGAFASAVPPETSISSIVSTNSSPSRSHAARIRSACSVGETNLSPSRSPTRESPHDADGSTLGGCRGCRG